MSTSLSPPASFCLLHWEKRVENDNGKEMGRKPKKPENGIFHGHNIKCFGQVFGQHRTLAAV